MHAQFDRTIHVLAPEVENTVKLRPPPPSNIQRFAKRWDHRLSDESLTQGASPLKVSARTLNPSATIPLGTGRSSSLYYPWQSMSMTGTPESSQARALSPADPMTCTKGEAAFDLCSALNYAEPSGCRQLVALFREYTSHIHSPPYQDWDTTLTCGSTSAIEIALRMFCNRGDFVLTETFTYPGTLMALRAQGLVAQGIEMDEGGLMPEDLDAKLRCWDSSRGRKPFVLYMIPSGHNPAGITQSTARKNAIYHVAEQHDLLILEDDPYFFLRLDESATSSDPCAPISRHGQFRESLPTSYLSIDKSGRVIRMESTSKILAPGLRCGWLTASRQIIDIFMDFVEVGPSTPSGPSQVMLYKLLVENWGQEGFVAWLNHLSGEYGSRRDAMMGACEEYLPKEVCTWTTPTHGMFCWITVSLEKHPEGAGKSIEHCRAIEDRIAERAEINGVLVARGSWFNAKSYVDKVFFRMTFVATASLDDLKLGVKQFSRAVREELSI